MTTKHVKKGGGRSQRLRRRRRAPPPPQPVNMGLHPRPLRLVAFSDYRVQDIDLLIEELSKLQPRPDLILYAGDDVVRFRPSRGKNLLEAIASRARYGLCAVAGNDDEPSVRELICGKSVFNVHLSPIVMGDYAVLGIDGAPCRRDLEGLGCILHSELEIKRHLSAQRRKVKSKKLIVLSHAPPEGVLDQAQRFSLSGTPRSIGSRALKKFLHTSNNAQLVVCGHVHRCGGQHKRVGRTLVVNAASHDDDRAVGRFAILELYASGRCEIVWRGIRETNVVPGIGPPSAERLRSVGIRTVEELASAPLELLGRTAHLGHSREVLKARAQAMVQEKPILLRPLELPSGPELFLDIETDLSQEYVWLIGLSAGRSGEYTSFFAEAPGEEKEILADFLNFAERFPTAWILTLSGSKFEQRVMSKRLACHGFPTSVCQRIIDLYWIIQPAVALPTGSYRVKEIGGYFGYRYKHPDLDGWEVALLYENRYQSLKNSSTRRKLARTLIEYNEDDVRCLPHILNSLRALESQTAKDG